MFIITLFRMLQSNWSTTVVFSVNTIVRDYFCVFRSKTYWQCNYTAIPC